MLPCQLSYTPSFLFCAAAAVGVKANCLCSLLDHMSHASCLLPWVESLCPSIEIRTFVCIVSLCLCFKDIVSTILYLNPLQYEFCRVQHKPAKASSHRWKLATELVQHEPMRNICQRRNHAQSISEVFPPSSSHACTGSC